MSDEMSKGLAQAQQESVEDRQTPRGSIVVTLVVPVDLDDEPWPPSEAWKEGPWPGSKDANRSPEARERSYLTKTTGISLHAVERRCHLADAEGHGRVGKFKIEGAELVRPDDRTKWGLVHLSIDNVKDLQTSASDLSLYVHLRQSSHIRQDERGGITEITDILCPARPHTGSRASAVVLLSGETAERDEKGVLREKLADALDIEPWLTFAEGTLVSEIRHAAVGLHGILIESSNHGDKKLKWHVQGDYAEQLLTARAQRAAAEGFVIKVAALFDDKADADELVREFYRWRARSWWSDISTNATPTAFLQSYQTVLRLPEIVKQLGEEMADYAAIAQEDAAKRAARSSNQFAIVATIFTVIAVPSTVGFTGAEVLGWHGGIGFLGALGITTVGSGLVSGAIWGLRRLRRGR